MIDSVAVAIEPSLPPGPLRVREESLLGEAPEMHTRTAEGIDYKFTHKGCFLVLAAPKKLRCMAGESVDDPRFGLL